MCCDSVKIMLCSSCRGGEGRDIAVRNGNTVFLRRQTHHISVYQLVKIYMEKFELKMGDHKFLFGRSCIRAGQIIVDWHKPITYSQYLSIFKENIAKLGHDPSKYGTHSARAGGATTLAEHISSFELLLCGRWRDERSIRNYVEVKEKRRWQISNYLSFT